MIISYKNQIENYTLTANAFSLTYPAANMQIHRLEKYWKGTNSDAVQDIIIDCGTAVTPGLIAILGHNFDTFASAPTIQFLGNTTNDFTTPAFSYTFLSLADIMYFAYTGAAYQYFCIRITGCTATDIPIIGYLWMDEDSFLFGSGLKVSEIHPVEYKNNSIFELGESGGLFSYRGNAVLRSYRILFDMLDASNFAYYKTMRDYVMKSEPLIIIWDESAEFPGVENIFCHFTTNLKIPVLYGFEGFQIDDEIEEIK